MSKKHSSNFFRSYFASPAKAEVEAPDVTRDNLSDPSRGKANTAPTKIVVSTGDSIQGDVVATLESNLAKDTDVFAGPFDVEVETR